MKIRHLPAWSRVLPEELTVPWLVKKLPALYETQVFITMFTRVYHSSLCWSRL